MLEQEGKRTNEVMAYGHCFGMVDSAPAADVVPKATVEQLKWERDTAIKQLESYGVGFCEEKKDLVAVVRCKDCKLYYDGNMGRYCQMTLCAVEAVDFCSYGKEKTDD